MCSIYLTISKISVQINFACDEDIIEHSGYIVPMLLTLYFWSLIQLVNFHRSMKSDSDFYLSATSLPVYIF